MSHIIDKKKITELVEYYTAEYIESLKPVIQDINVTSGDELKEQITETIYNTLKQIIISENNNNNDLLNLLKEDKQLFNTFIKSITLYELLDKYLVLQEDNYKIEIKDDDNKELIVEEISTFSAAVIAMINMFIGLVLIAIVKLPQRVKINIMSKLYQIAKKIQKISKDYYLYKWFFQKMPPQCIKLISYVNDKEVIDIEKIKKLVYKKSIPPALINFDPQLAMKKFGLDQVQAVDCMMRYLINYVGLTLGAFYKCLYDNKQFMDLIKIKNSPVEILTKLDKVMLDDIERFTTSSCYQHYKIFKEYYDIVSDLLLLTFKPYDKEYKILAQELRKTIQSANTFAQELLDKGKINQKDNNHKTNNQNNKR